MGKESIIADDLLKDITEFCTLNEIDTTVFINKLLKDAYLEFKWLDKTPITPIKTKTAPEVRNKIEEPQPIVNKLIKNEKKDLYGE